MFLKDARANASACPFNIKLKATIGHSPVHPEHKTDPHSASLLRGCALGSCSGLRLYIRTKANRADGLASFEELEDSLFSLAVLVRAVCIPALRP